MISFDKQKIKLISFSENAEKEFYGLYLKTDNDVKVLFNIDNVDVLLPYIGLSKYRFRKGIGTKGIVMRLFFIEKKNNNFVFGLYTIKNRRLKRSNKTIKIPSEEVKYIYPFITSPMIKSDKLEWYDDFIIFPYEIGNRQPVKEETLQKESPVIYNYLLSNRSILEDESVYNKRIQNKKTFYGVIRVGEYTFRDCFVAIRDNTKLVAQVVKKIKTPWGEEKIPIFDNHISYLSENVDREPLDYQECEKIMKVLNSSSVKAFIENYYDLRSIGSRFPIKIEEIIKNESDLQKLINEVP